MINCHYFHKRSNETNKSPCILTKRYTNTTFSPNIVKIVQCYIGEFSWKRNNIWLIEDGFKHSVNLRATIMLQD